MPFLPELSPPHLAKAAQLGSRSFRDDYGIRYAYVCGSMYKGIASEKLVIRLGQAGMLGFLGTGGLSLEDIERRIGDIKETLGPHQPFGANLLHAPTRPDLEMATVDRLLLHGVRIVEASAFMKVSPALVKFRAKGLKRDASGETAGGNRIIAKLSRPEIAEMFLAPPPQRLLASLVEQSQITKAEAELAARLPLADDICAEAESAGHTDGAVASTLIPTIVRMRDRAQANFAGKEVRVGAAGGIGTPEAAAAALISGADFILTGSINQCTCEARISDAVKDMLQDLNVQDTEYAPAGDMFEVGARIQVMKKGVLFPARAQKLYDLWRTHRSFEEIDSKVRKQIQEKFFGRSFAEAFEETKAHYDQISPDEMALVERDPKAKMALVFRWYFVHSTRLALAGDYSKQVDFQVHTGPAIGAFNQWVAGTAIADWRKRHVDEIGQMLMAGAALHLEKRWAELGLQDCARMRVGSGVPNKVVNGDLT